MQRRELFKAASAVGLVGAVSGCSVLSGGAPSKARVVVVGGGYGGATAAKYLRLFSDKSIDVVLIEPNREFLSCPISNLVVAGMKSMQDIRTSYDGLRAHGVTVVHDWVASIDADKRRVILAGGGEVAYEKLILSPGVDLMMDTVQGLAAANANAAIVQAWKAGPETLTLAKQLQDMRDGGVFAITIPEAPYRCPPGPYERASVVAAYFKKHKPKSKVLILDANPDVTSKGPLFKKAWSELYGSMVEYRPQHKATGVDAAKRIVKFDVQDDVKADVLNVIPMMRAGALAVKSGLATANARWCPVNYQTFESTAAKHIHVIGDSIQVAPLMPKSGHMANSHAKVAAAAVVAQLTGKEVNDKPMLTNTCYSFVGADEVIHVASVHEYVAAEKTFKTVAGSGGVSAARSSQEAIYALAWAKNIWADSLA